MKALTTISNHKKEEALENEFWGEWKHAETDRKPITITLNGQQHTLVPQCIGRGDDKGVYQLDSRQVLMLPSSTKDVLPPSKQRRWQLVVQHELNAVRTLRQHGLLTSEIYPSVISYKGVEIPALVSRSFDSLAEKGIEVLDRNWPEKNKSDTIWFANREQLDDPAHYRKLFDPVMDDLAQLFLSNIIFKDDTINLAVQHSHPVNTARDQTEAVVIGNDTRLRLFPYDMMISPKPIYDLEGKTREEMHAYIHEKFSRVVYNHFVDSVLMVIPEMPHKPVFQAISDNVETQIDHDQPYAKDYHQFYTKVCAFLRTPELEDELINRMENRILDEIEKMHPVLRKRQFSIPSAHEKSR